MMLVRCGRCGGRSGGKVVGSRGGFWQGGW